MSKIRAYARGMQCQIRIPMICTGDPTESVMAHYRLAGLNGAGQKPPDFLVSIACRGCHDAVDGRIKTPYDKQTLRLYHAEGVFRTQNLLHLDGLL